MSENLNAVEPIVVNQKAHRDFNHLVQKDCRSDFTF